MFEKGSYRDTPSVSVQSVPAQKKKVQTPSEAAGSAAATAAEKTAKSLPQQVSVISSQVVFKGELMAGDEMVIHGTVEGTIAHRSKNVVVAKDGKVRALIHATIVKVEGQVDGDIHGDEFVELAAGARVDGDIYCASIRIERGARLNGSVHMA